MKVCCFVFCLLRVTYPLILPGNFGIEKYNQTDYISHDLTKPGTEMTHLRMENNSLYILESIPDLKFADYRGNKVYITVCWK